MARYTVDLNVYGGTSRCAEFDYPHDADVYAAELIRLPYVEEVCITDRDGRRRILVNHEYAPSGKFFPRISDWVCFIGTLAMFGVGIAVAYIR